DEVDDAVLAPEGHRRLRALLGQGIEASALPARQHDSENPQSHDTCARRLAYHASGRIPCRRGAPTCILFRVWYRYWLTFESPSSGGVSSPSAHPRSEE